MRPWIQILCEPRRPAHVPERMPPNRESARASVRRQRGHLTEARLEALVEEAIVDAYGDSEQVTGLYTLLEENLALPFETVVLGVDVTVEKLDLSEEDDIVVVCCRGQARQTVRLLDLPIPDPPPEGWQWIEAYRYWARGWRGN